MDTAGRKKKQMEDLVEEVGGCGRFQLMLVPLALSYTPMAVWSMMFMVFGAKEPDWWFISRDIFSNQSQIPYYYEASHGLSLNPSKIPYHFNGSPDLSLNQSDGLSEAEDGDVYTSHFRAGLLDNTTYKNCPAVIDSDGQGRIIFAPGLHTVVVEFWLVCDRAWVVPLTISAQMFGVFVGASIGGQLGDSLGRKRTMILMTSLHAAFNLVTGFSVSWEMFAAFRTLVGLTIGGLLSCCWPYPTEFIGVRWRSMLGSIPMWGIGAVTFSLLVWVLPHWSHVHMATAACTASSLLVWCFLPESVRWLSTRGHVSRAHAVLCKMARWNGRSAPSMRSVEDLSSIKSERKYTYFHLFSTWPLAKISIINGFMWFSASMAYYGIAFGTKDLAGDFNLNFFLLSIVEIPPNLCCYVLLKLLGRRKTCAGSFFLTAGSCMAALAVSLLVSGGQSDSYINGLCMSAKMGLNLGWSAMSVFAAELYPTVVRNIAFGFLNTVARVSGVMAPYLLSMNEVFAFYAIVGSLMTFAALGPLLLRETKGQPLQDLLPESSSMKDVINGYDLDPLSEASQRLQARKSDSGNE